MCISGGSEELWAWDFIHLAELFNVSEGVFFPHFWEVLSVFPAFENVGEKSQSQSEKLPLC